MERNRVQATEMNTFSAEWIAAWNSHDLERILRLYRDDATMQSEYIRSIAGDASGMLSGKAQLRSYWQAAFEKLPDLHFSHLATCSGVGSVAIHYVSVHDRLAIEVFHFDEAGLVRHAYAHYA